MVILGQNSDCVGGLGMTYSRWNHAPAGRGSDAHVAVTMAHPTGRSSDRTRIARSSAASRNCQSEGCNRRPDDPPPVDHPHHCRDHDPSDVG